MTEINPQERQRLKQQAAQMAITDANLSQYMAAAAAAVALASPLHGAILAVGAGALGVCGNYRQAVANDPPREDFDQIWVTGASFDESMLPDEEPMASTHRFAANHVVLMDALFALLRSIERHDGAVNAGEVDAASAQADAARQNAARAADLQETLGVLGQNMNHVIVSLRVGGPTFNSLSLDEIVQLYRDAWGEPPESPGDALQNVTNSVTGAAEDVLKPFDPDEAHPILSATELPADRDMPFDETYLTQLSENSLTLRSLVDG